MQAEIRDSELLLLIDGDIYSEEVLHKAFYWYTGNSHVEIGRHSENMFLVKLRPKSDTVDFQEMIDKIKRDLIDFRLRDIVSKETKTIRELIIAKAFAYNDLEDNPITSVSDPVGFDPDGIAPIE